jgi:hypothetical protein
MAVVVISTAAQNAAVDAIAVLIDAGSGEGTLGIYDGAQPASPHDGVTTQNRLVTLTFSAKAFADAVNGIGAANEITIEQSIATGTATWFRVFDSDFNAILDGDVTDATDLPGEGALRLDTKEIEAGVPISIANLTLTMPSGAV